MATSLLDLSILILDEDEVRSRGLKSALLSRGCREVHYSLTSSAACDQLSLRRFDIAFIYCDIKELSYISLTERLRAISPTTLLVAISERSSWSLAQELELIGISALIAHPIGITPLIAAITQLLQNPRNFLYIGERGTPRLLARLTASERAVLTSLADGLTTREIAKTRHSSEATIKSHLTSIYRKLEVRNRVEAIAHLYL